ncbi:MAG TPA: hypothetical protein VFN44_03310, partial [Solirubrobacteraceae bacterium]|nr:hypothetical protein [Solirubrobacteraceae bacterium]
SVAAGGALQAGMSTLATKAVAGLAAAAIVTAGAAEVKHVAQKDRSTGGATTLAAVAPQTPPVAAAESAPVPPVPVRSAPQPAAEVRGDDAKGAGKQDVPAAGRKVDVKPVPAGEHGDGKAPNTEQHDGDTSTLPTETTGTAEPGSGSLGPGTAPSEQSSQPATQPPPEQTAKPTPEPTPVPTTEPAPEPTPDPTVTPEPTPDPAPTPTPTAPPAFPPAS